MNNIFLDVTIANVVIVERLCHCFSACSNQIQVFVTGDGGCVHCKDTGFLRLYITHKQQALRYLKQCVHIVFVGHNSGLVIVS